MARSTSSFETAISLGTAELTPLSPHKPRVMHVPGPSVESEGIFERHRLPSPPATVSRPMSEVLIDRASVTPRQETRRRSVLDPGSIRLSFTGSLPSTSSPWELPLEEGLQKLYQLYEENTPESPPLPKAVKITDVPLDLIADSLEARIKEQRDALEECADNIKDLCMTNEKKEGDLIKLEFRYCLARQEANMRSMTSNDFRQRLAWMKEEVNRLSAERERALMDNLEQMREKDQLRQQLMDMLDLQLENQKLKAVNVDLELKKYMHQRQMADVEKQLDETRFALKSVPSSILKLCAKVLVPDRKRNRGRNGVRDDIDRSTNHKAFL